MRINRLGLLVILCGAAFGQAQFEVASVKPNDLSKRGGEGSRKENVIANPGSLTMVNVTLKSAIQWAYNVKSYQVSGPDWMTDGHFDISGRAATSADDAQLRKMLQTLLVNRFKVAVHHEVKEIPMYALVVDKGGLKMKPSTGSGESKLQPSGLTLVATNSTIQDLSDFLSTISTAIPILNVPVIDATGVKGRFDFTVDGSEFLQSVRAAAVPGQQPSPDLIIEGVREILKSQLGLKAESRKLPGDFVVVDHAERTPVEN